MPLEVNAARTQQTLIERLGFRDSDLTSPQHDQIMLWLDALLREPEFVRRLARHQAAELREQEWEHALNDGRWVSGFLDLLARIAIPFNGAQVRVAGEVWAPPRELFGFEVKTVVPSLGELIRQIRFYEAKSAQQDLFDGERYRQRSAVRFYVVSPDAKVGGPLASQGIGFIHYPSTEITYPEGINAR